MGCLGKFCPANQRGFGVRVLQRWRIYGYGIVGGGEDGGIILAWVVWLMVSFLLKIWMRAARELSDKL